MGREVKRVAVLLAAIVLVAGIAGCTESVSAHAGQTVTGKTTSVKGTNVSMELGDIEEQEWVDDDIDMPAGGQPPAKPEGDAGAPNDAPDMPAGGQPQGQPPTARLEFVGNGKTMTVNLGSFMPAELQVGDILQVSFGPDGKVQSADILKLDGPGGINPGGFGGNRVVNQGTAATNIDADTSISGQTFESSGEDENALRVTGATVTLDDLYIDKSGGASTNVEDGDFYGMNAAFLATDGAHVSLSGSTVLSNAQNGNGVFSYGSGTVVDVADCTIETKADNSGGIQTTGGATTNARNLAVQTHGNSAAAIRSDRGGGIVNVDGGSYTSNGLNSPAVYSTADVIVKNASLAAKGSEALVIEGQNSITLENCDVEGSMDPVRGSSSDENVHNVMIYQSMSGDAELGRGWFSMTGGSLKAATGDMFYLTNTQAGIALNGVDLEPSADGALLRAVGNSASRGWGQAGKNGAQVEMTANGQRLEGDIVVDTVSTLRLVLSEGSSFEGAVSIVENARGGEGFTDNVMVVVGPGCTWKLTGDCSVSILENLGEIDFNGFTITLADGTVLS